MFRTCLVLCAFTLLVACGDPLAGVPRISEVDLAQTGSAAAALPSDEEMSREGFFGTAAATGDAPTPLTPRTAPRPTGGFLGLFSKPRPDNSRNTPAAARDTRTKAGSNPLSGLLGTASAGGDLLEVEYGTVLPYGTIARTCDAKGRDLGRKVEKTGRFTLYDSNPGITAQRSFYITGFGDGCPRKLTAAHVLLGPPSLYEQLHYGPAGQHLTFGDTDKAYERVKRQVCGAGRGKPCGSKIRSLDRSTVFVNSYERFNDNARWSEHLIHNGHVVARSMKQS